MSRVDELKSRIEAKRKQLEADLAQAKADAQGKSAETVKAIEGRLKELSESLRDGWDKASDATLARLNEWLKK